MTFTICEMFFIYVIGYILGTAVTYFLVHAPWNRK